MVDESLPGNRERMHLTRGEIARSVVRRHWLKLQCRGSPYMLDTDRVDEFIDASQQDQPECQLPVDC